MILKNGIIEGRFRGWLRVENGHVAEVGEGEYREASDGVGNSTGGCTETVEDMHGALLLPGAIDDHVHFREPGMEHKGTIASESRAAVAGGVTCVMDMPNTTPATTSRAALDAKMELAACTSMTNYAFWLGATADNLHEIRHLDPRVAAGVKVFMGSSTGGMLVDEPNTLAAIFAESPVLVGTHCEDEAMIGVSAAAALKEFGDAATAAVHPLVRSAEACYRSTARAVELADRYGTQLHVLHISSARELSLFDTRELATKKITAEACAHHLWFTDADYARLGNLIKVNPAIKTAADRQALREAVLNGKIDLVATDHAPHTLDEKRRTYWDAPSGAPAIQHSLCAMLEIFESAVVAEKMCAAPALRFGLRDRGSLRPGAVADIVVLRRHEETDYLRQPEHRRQFSGHRSDHSEEWRVELPAVGDSPVYYKCGWSPMAGARLRWSVERTIIAGRTVFDRGQFDEGFRGEALKFDR